MYHLLWNHIFHYRVDYSSVKGHIYLTLPHTLAVFRVVCLNRLTQRSYTFIISTFVLHAPLITSTLI
jgi:hypothetical protein